MVRSMTAYGKGEHLSPEGHFIVEIHSLNRKHLEVGIQLPRELSSFEADLRRWIAASIARGKVQLKIYATYEERAPFTIRPNLPLVRQLKRAWSDIVAVGGIDPKDDQFSNMLCRQPELFLFEESFDESVYREQLEAAVKQALEALCTMKLREGKELEKEFFKRIAVLRGLLEEIASHAPKAAEKQKDKLAKKLEEALPGRPENEERLLREICLYADRVDISEEISRFTAHLYQFDHILGSKEKEKGKALEFLLQEMHREVNTMGAKSDLMEILRPVLLMKGEIEKIKEQVQNIE